MHYLLMCCFDEKRWDALPSERRDEIMHCYRDLIDGWIAAGRYVTGGKLAASTTATTVRSRDGRPAITD